MKHALSLAFVIGLTTLHTHVCAQERVGVRQPNPTEALDVNGNIQLSGALKVNGETGTAGQALTSTGTGLTWSNITINTPLSRWQAFSTPMTNTTWNVPAGVTEVFVEIWGAGGGGSSATAGTGGGGGSGAYSCAVIDVNSVPSLTIAVGSGGSGGRVANGQAGTASEVRWTRFAVNYRIQSAGGLGATTDAGGAGAPITGSATVVPSDISIFQLPGQPGNINRFFHTVAADGTFYRRFYGAEGGSPYQFDDYAKPGSNSGFDPTVASTASSVFDSDSHNISLPGFGGGGNLRATDSGADGGNGLVIIRW